MKVHAFKQLLSEHGWIFLRQSGTSHEIWRKQNTDGTWRNERWTAGGNAHNEVEGGLLVELKRRFGLDTMVESIQPKPRGGFQFSGKVALEGTLGRRIYDAQEAAGLNQTALSKLIAEELKVDHMKVQPTISSWERGESNPFLPGTNELRVKRNKNGEAPLSFQIIGVLAQLFGWNDLMHYRVLKSATQQLSVVETEPENFETVITEVHKQIPEVFPESLPMSRIAALESPEEAPIPDVVKSKDDKALIKILHASDVIQFIIDLENENRKLRKENNALQQRATIPADLAEKARKYDEIQRLLGK